MPELRFAIRWPDGTQETCYSPSTIIRNYFESGATYPTADFLTRCRTALTAASNRVQAIHGTPCALALGQLARIEATASRYPANALVRFDSFKD